MPRTAPLIQIARVAGAVLLFYINIATSHAADTYITASHQLSMPSLVIGGATYSQVVITVGKIVSGPNGSAPNGSNDSYDPGTNQVNIQTVMVSASTYHNVVVTVAGLVSIGGVTGANIFNGASLNIPYVQVGGTIYSNVVIGVGRIISVSGGMPTFVTNTYDPFTSHLAIPVVLDQPNNEVYTNVVATVGSVTSVTGISSSVTQSVLHSFGGAGAIASGDDGATPNSLIQGSDGTLYGATASGGAYDQGTVFKITTEGAESVLYSFSGNGGIAASADGAAPSSLVMGRDGRLYGTTYSGGAYAEGAVFAMTTTGVETIIYSFKGHGGIAGSVDGATPVALMQGQYGNLFGTTAVGGVYDEGTVFSMTSAGVESVLYSFTGGSFGIIGSTDGAYPQAGVTQDDVGNLYGTTFSGGAYAAGTIFRITAAGSESVLHSFTGGASGISGSVDGAGPEAGLTLGSDGNFYGTNIWGGEFGQGTVFRITTAGIETVVHSFSGANSMYDSNDGANPTAALIQGSDGNLYGTASRGGPMADGDGGIIYKITKTGVETVLYSFDGATGHSAGGDVPEHGLIESSDGTIYGTAYYGGAHNEGVVFKATEVVASQ